MARRWKLVVSSLALVTCGPCALQPLLGCSGRCWVLSAGWQELRFCGFCWFFFVFFFFFLCSQCGGCFWVCKHIWVPHLLGFELTHSPADGKHLRDPLCSVQPVDEWREEEKGWTSLTGVQARWLLLFPVFLLGGLHGLEDFQICWWWLLRTCCWHRLISWILGLQLGWVVGAGRGDSWYFHGVLVPWACLRGTLEMSCAGSATANCSSSCCSVPSTGTARLKG